MPPASSSSWVPASGVYRVMHRVFGGRNGHAGDEGDRAGHHEARKPDAPMAEERVVETKDEREPPERSVGDGLEGVEHRTFDQPEHVGTDHEAEQQVLAAGGKTEAADRAAADEEAPDVREHEQPHEQKKGVHGRRLALRPRATSSRTRAAARAVPRSSSVCEAGACAKMR